MFIKSSLIEQEVHKSMNFVHDLATLGEIISFFIHDNYENMK